MTTTSTTGPDGPVDREYFYGRVDDLATEQLAALSGLLDRQSIDVLEATGVTAGRRCLDLGSGTGTIAEWLAGRVAPDGSVVAVDTDIRRLRERSGLQILEHDINEGVPGGPYDLIHARLLLMHLAHREQILQDLVDALAPGGWLVIGDFAGPQTRVLSSPSPADTALFHRIQHTAHQVVGRAASISGEWAHEIDGAMTTAGLCDVATIEYTPTSAGGSTGCLLSLNYVRQMQDPLLANGITHDELERYAALMHDPRFRAWFYPFLCSRGQRDTTETMITNPQN